MPHEPEPIIIDPPGQRGTDPRPGDYRLYDEDFPVEVAPSYQTIKEFPPLRFPHFPIGEVSVWAFGRNRVWVKDRLKRIPSFTYGNSTLVIRQVPGRGVGAERRLTLPDIERLAWVLYEHGHIDGFQLQRASEIAVAVARQYGVGAVEQTGAP
ncbi:hypothetical protein ACWD7M_16780 [Streptomyces griseus]